MPQGEREWADFRRDRCGGAALLRAHFVQHRYDRHAHDEYSIGMTESGSQSFECRGVRHVTRPGSVMFFNPGEAHDGRATDAGGFVYRIIYLPVAAMHDLAGEAAHRAAAEPLFTVPMAFDPDAARDVAAAWDALAGADALAQDEALGALLFRVLGRYAAPAIGRGDDAPPATLQRARDLIADRFADAVDLAALAREAGLSRFHLSRAFRRRFGMSPSEFRRLRRLEHARTLLARGGRPADAAAAAGFADQAHLTRAFKRAYGITPARFRRAVA